MAAEDLSTVFHRVVDAAAALGSRLADILLPGATDAEVQAAEDRLGFMLVPEVKEWFTIQGGVDEQAAPTAHYQLVPEWRPIGIDEAVELHADAMFNVGNPAATEVFVDGINRWCPIASSLSGVLVLADCADPRASAIHELDFEKVPDGARPVVAESISALLRAWLASYDAGEIVWRDPGGLIDRKFVNG